MEITKIRYFVIMVFKRFRVFSCFILVFGMSQIINGQDYDSLKVERFSIHAQATIINQFKPAFHATYS
jgi:hypothetical protein